MAQPAPDPRLVAHSPLIEAYLADLQTALRGADPAERDEVLMTVREHIDASLREKDGPIGRGEVESVLAALGSVDRVVASLDYRDHGAHPLDHGDRSDPEPLAAQPPAWPRWLGAAVVVAGALSLPLIVFMPPVAVFLAVVAVTMGILGSRLHEGRDKRPYRVGAVLGSVTAALVIVAALGFLAFSGADSGPLPSSPEQVPTPSAS